MPRLIAIILSILTMFAGIGTVFAESFRTLGIGTGGIAGTYYPVGRAIATIINGAASNCASVEECPLHDVVAVPELSGGTIANLENLARNQIQLALVQADQIPSEAELSYSLVSAIYTEAVHMVVRAESGIRTPADLAGRAVSIDEEGSGTRATALAVLESYGIPEQRFDSTFFKPEFAAERLVEGKLDAFFIVSGVPTKSVTDASRQLPIRLLPIDGEHARTLVTRFRYLRPLTIAAGAYRGIPATDTVGVEAYLVARRDLDEGLVHAIMELLWSRDGRRELIRVHPPIADVSLNTAVRDKALTVHPGVARYLAGRDLPLD